MLELFRQDAARWIVPGQVLDPSLVTLPMALKLLYRNSGLRAILWFRFGSWCHRQGIRFLPGFSQWWILRHYGLELVIGAPIGGGFYVAHTVGVTIASKSIGKNCSVIASVTVGMRNTWDFPTIGDNVFIGAGARVLGGICVGDNAQIGANAVVVHDVPAGTTVVGIPARPVMRMP
jgi:serine O-acetyltransferase